MSRPNVLLIVVDCLRADRSVEAGRSAVAPTLDRLAESGALFTHVITVNSSTVPCVTSLMTGLYPMRHGVRKMVGTRLPDDVTTLADVFRGAGYHTVAETTGPVTLHHGLHRGFDEFHRRHSTRQHLYTAWGDALIARLRDRGLPEPWFLYLHLWEVHQPRRVLPEFDRPEFGDTTYDRAISNLDHRLKDILDALPANTLVALTGDHGEKFGQGKVEQALDRAKTPVRDGLTRMGIKPKRFRWVADVRFRLLRFLRDRGAIKNSLATMIGHGFHVYDYLVRVPLILHHPDFLPGASRVTEQVRQVDIRPTLLELLGIPDPAAGALDGQSLVSLLHGRPLTPQPAFLESSGAGVRESRKSLWIGGVRVDNWKYTYGVNDPTLPEELYDLRTDPAERHNLVAERADRRAELRAMAQAFFDSNGQANRPDARMTPDEIREVERRLIDLGYME